MDREHVERLRKSVAGWNAWRKEYRKIRPSLGGANLSGANLNQADLNQADLSGANLSGANLNQADLNQADLSGADLSGADLSGADLSGAHLNQANLNQADLNQADLGGANLSGANLNQADLSGADLSGADLSGADLSGARLNQANLNQADLNQADLGGANLNQADLGGANLSGANLNQADLSGADLFETVFGGTNLTDCKGLDNCVHYGPSTVDHRTIQQSGSLPLAFLRGVGMPDSLIDYLPALLNQPIQYFSCFISYSSDDEDFAQRIHADLQSKGLRCWFAREDIKAGKKLDHQIDEAIRRHDKLLLILSKHSMNSRWVAVEIRRAGKKETKQNRQMLFPLRLCPYKELEDWKLFDADTVTDLAAEVREYFIPDFSDWKNHNSYGPAFKQLLRDLQQDVNAPAK